MTKTDTHGSCAVTAEESLPSGGGSRLRTASLHRVLSCAAVLGVCLSGRVAFAGATDVRRGIRREENKQASVASLTSRAARDLRLVVDEYQYNRLTQEGRTALLSDVSAALQKLADPRAAEKIQNMPWVATQLATARQSLSDSEGTEDARRTLLSAWQGQGVILDELEKLVLKTREELGKANTEKALQELLEKQEKLLEETQDLSDQTLGKDADELTPEEAAQAEKLAQDQKGLRQELDRAMDELRETAESVKESDPAQTQAIEETLDRLEREDVDDKMEEAGQDIEENQLSAAQEEQKEIIDALQNAQEGLADDSSDEMSELEQDLAALQDMAERQEDLLQEAEDLDQESSQMDYNDLQADQANLQADLQEAMEQSESQEQAAAEADAAMEEAKDALGEQKEKEAVAGMEKALENLKQAAADKATRLAQMKAEKGMMASKQGTQKPQQGNKPGKKQGLKAKTSKEYKVTATAVRKGERSDDLGASGWNVKLAPGEREVLVNAVSEKFPPRYEKEIIMYYRNLASAGSVSEE